MIRLHERGKAIIITEQSDAPIKATQHKIRSGVLAGHIINTLVGLFQLSLLLLFYLAISQSSLAWQHSFLWLETVSAPDPRFILPALASALFVFVLALQGSGKIVRKSTLFVLGGVVLFGLLHQLAAAVNLYLALSMALLILQSTVSKAIGKAAQRATANGNKTETIIDTGLVTLAQAHYLAESTGKRAARLGELLEAGYNVPDGIVFTSEITNKSRRNPDKPLLTRRQSRILNELWKDLRASKVAVRSSGAGENCAGSSFAGAYESILNVTRDNLEAAVKEVYQSMCSDRSAAYTQGILEEGMVATLDQGGVVVQKMVPAEYTGVMFTEHPGTSGAMMVEMNTALGEGLISSNDTSHTFACGKLTSELLLEDSSIDVLPPMDVAPLLALGRELEARFGHPQDIEWAYAKGKFYLLQVRNITRPVSRGKSLRNLAERERRKLLQNLLGQRKRVRRTEPLAADEPVYVQSELSKLPSRPTPFSSDFMERLWSVGGGTDLACRELGIPYHVHPRSMPYINTIFGWVYINQQEERRRLGKGPGALASFRLARNAEATEAQFRDEFLPRFQLEMVERDAIAMERMTLASATSLLNAWVDRFVHDTYYTTERINISADFHIKSALEKLNGANLEPAQFLNNEGETVVSHAMSLLERSKVTREKIDELLMIFGHRAPLDYEFSDPRFNEGMNLIQEHIERSIHSNSNDIFTAIQKDIDATTSPLPDSKVLAISVQRARNFMRLKEEVKHFCLIELAQIRRLLLAIDEKCHLDGRVFQLTINEVIQLNNPEQREALVRIADQRFEESSVWNALRLPASLSLNDLERIDMLTGTRRDAKALTERSGTRVSGEQEVIGKVRVIADIDQIHCFKEGEILITRMTGPAWHPLFSKARGIVTEVGGWSSHAAIVAREYDLPAIAGFSNACQRLQTGDVIRMTLAGTVEILEERRTPASSVSEASSPIESIARAVAENEQILLIEDETAPINIYQLSSRMIFKYQERLDRRALKNSLGERRAKSRYTESGEIQPDRRAANQAASTELYKKVG